MNKRNIFFDIVKAIGIISIVIGHCWVEAIPFVYTYHLVIFFFVSGYFYNFEKYAKKPYDYIGNRLKGSYGKYILYGIIFVLLHNSLVKIGIYQQNTIIYSLRTIIEQFVSTSILLNSEIMLGAMWFVPVLVYSMALFGFSVYYVEKVPIKSKSFAIGSICFLFGILGLVFTRIDYTIIYHLQTAFLIMPIVFLGYLLKKKVSEQQLMKYLKMPIMIVSIIVIIAVLRLTGSSISLADGRIIDPVLFYPISAIGIYFCLCLAKALTQLPRIANAFSIIGRYSFDIMALHFVGFKIIDLIYIYLTGKDIVLLSIFPISFKELYPIYIVFGTLFPVICCVIVQKMRIYFLNKVSTSKK